MTNEKMLSLINKAIGNLKDSEDGYGQTPIDYMRKNGIKSTDNMTFFTDSVGAYLEELRQGILTDIEAAEAKKNGKSSVLSAVKKLYKEMHTAMCNTKPFLAYAHYDAEDNKYWMCSGYWMLISETCDGMTLCPENIEKETLSPFQYKKSIPDTYNYEKLTLPPIGKVSAYLKQAKANKKGNKGWDRIILNSQIGVKAEWLEAMMKITGATELYWKPLKAMVMEGNGYKAVLMPIRLEQDEQPTDFNNI